MTDVRHFTEKYKPGFSAATGVDAVVTHSIPLEEEMEEINTHTTTTLA